MSERWYDEDEKQPVIQSSHLVAGQFTATINGPYDPEKIERDFVYMVSVHGPYHGLKATTMEDAKREAVPFLRAALEKALEAL